MKLSFEPNLEYQQEAISAVIGLFEGQSLEDLRLQQRIKAGFEQMRQIGGQVLIYACTE